MSERVPGKRRGVRLIYHRPTERGRRRAYRRARRDYPNEEPILLAATHEDTPAATPYTVERLVEAVDVWEDVEEPILRRIQRYWGGKDVPIKVVRRRS